VNNALKSAIEFIELHSTKLFAALLIIIFIIVSASSASDKYATVDESVYVASGYSYVKTLDLRMNPEHPILAKTLFGLSLLPLNPTLPLDAVSWSESEQIGTVGKNYNFAADFFKANKEIERQIIFTPRIVSILLTVFLALLVFLWSKDLFGKKAALLSLFLFVFSPNILAHSRLATLDIALTTFIFASFYFLHLFMKTGKTSTIAASAVFFSFACLTKFSALVFLPFIFLFIAFNRNKLPENRSRFLKKINNVPFYLVAIALFIVIPLLVANLFYFLDSTGNSFGVIPTRLVDGYNFIQGWVSSGREGFLLGEMRTEMPEYFLAAFLMKETIPFIALLLASFYLLFKKPRKDVGLMLMPAIGFFVLVSLFTKFYLGLRYILPVFPFLFVFCGILLAGKRWKKILKDRRLLYLFIVIIAFHAISSLAVYPHFLAYFNETINPSDATDYLSDSNLDWGQDLYFFQDYVKENNIEKVNFIFFGWPFYDERFPQAYYNKQCGSLHGNVAISATALVGRDSTERKCFEWLRAQKPRAKIGFSIYFFELE